MFTDICHTLDRKLNVSFNKPLLASENLAFDVMALGGIYIAGGIVTKNLSLFKRKVFIEEFRLTGGQVLASGCWIED